MREYFLVKCAKENKLKESLLHRLITHFEVVQAKCFWYFSAAYLVFHCCRAVGTTRAAYPPKCVRGESPTPKSNHEASKCMPKSYDSIIIYLKYLIILKHTESEEVEIAAHYWLPATPKCSAAPLHCHVADYSLAICQILGALKDLTPISLSQAVTGCLKTRYPWVHHGYTNPTHGLSFVYSQLQSFTILSHH